MHRIDLTERPGLVAAMSDRGDGDCRNHPDTEPNRRAFLRKLGLDRKRLVTVRQVHGDTVLDAADVHDPDTEADGLVTDDPNVVLGIAVADCVPILLAAPNAIALLHAGREGTRKTIAARGVDALHAIYGVVPKAITAWIGPSAGPCCYEVSAAMAREFHEKRGAVQGRHLDLWAANRRELNEAGVPTKRIVVDGRCTICGDVFYSYRRDATSARNLAVAARNGTAA